jgi:hypothetical protein
MTSTAKQYTVNAVIQCGPDTGVEPEVSVQWYKGDNGMKAISALAGAAVNDEEKDWGDLPETMRYRTLSVTMTIEEVEVEGATPSTEPGPVSFSFDSETNDYSLSDCAWWDMKPQYRPWWAKADCSGPRIGDTAHGVLCEGHFNAIPKGGE